jgi:hypothetical protein
MEGFAKLCAVTTLALVASMGRSNATNILVNPGFESGALAPWFQDRSFSGGENWNVTTVTPHTGSFAATDTGNKELKQTFSPTTTSQIDQVSLWAKHDNLTGRELFVDFFYSDGTDQGFTVSTTDLSYDFFNVTSDLATGKLLDGISVFGNSSPGPDPSGFTRTWVDDFIIDVAAVPEPASLGLLVTGLVCLELARRRKRQRQLCYPTPIA